MVAGETTPDEILRLIGLLIYFGFVDVKGGGGSGIGAQQLFSTASGQDLSCPGCGLEPLWPYCMLWIP